MSANLLDGARHVEYEGTTYASGVWSVPANGADKQKNAVEVIPQGTEAVAENQTLHIGLSVRADDGASVVVGAGIGYVDAAGHTNYTGATLTAKGTGSWQRLEASLVMPSGMRVSLFFVHQGANGAAYELTNPVLSYGSPVAIALSSTTLAWSAGILATVRYYQLAAATSATPAVPTSSADLGAWTETEPAADTTKVLWTCERVVYADGTESWSKASKSTSYEAAKDAKSTAVAAKDAASAAQITANATASHFWMDAAGQANVSTDAGTVATGNSVTIGSKGIIQRLDGKLMQSLTKTALNFYLVQSGTPLLAAAYTPDGMGVFAAGKQLSSFTGSGAVFYDGASDSTTEGNVNASFGADGAIIGKRSGMHAALSSGAFDIRNGDAGVFAAGILRTTRITDALGSNPAAGASFQLSHVPVAAPSVYLRYDDVSTGTIADRVLAAGADYTVDGQTVALSSSWAAPDYTENDGVLYAEYSYASDAPEVSIGDGNVVMTYSAPNEPDFIGMDGGSGMEWTLTNQGNVRCRRSSDGGASWTAWEYFSKEGHRHSANDIRGWRYGLWKAKTVSKNYTIKANSNTTVEITTKPDSGYVYNGVLRIFTQHQTAVKVSGWNVNTDSVSIDLSNHGNSSAISSSTLTVQLLELKA